MPTSFSEIDAAIAVLERANGEGLLLREYKAKLAALAVTEGRERTTRILATPAGPGPAPVSGPELDREKLAKDFETQLAALFAGHKRAWAHANLAYQDQKFLADFVALVWDFRGRIHGIYRPSEPDDYLTSGQLSPTPLKILAYFLKTRSVTAEELFVR